jgi:hypothetical protein
MTPNYTKIYTDMISELFPMKLNDPDILRRLKEIKTIKDVIILNNILFKNGINKVRNQKLKCYDLTTMETILKYQKTHQLTDTHIARQYHMSRNTVAKWKKILITE